MESWRQQSPRGRFQAHQSRMLLVPGILASACLGAACVVHDWVKERCVQRVAAEIDSGNPVATSLAAGGNPKGEGFVVFSKSESCAPKFMWVTVSDGSTFKVYAVDAPSQALTPKLDLLTSAPASERRKLGVDAESFGRIIRDEFCRTNRSARLSG
jgi:hypothetical protein